MIADEKTIREAALKLPSQQRVELIRELQMSLDSDAILQDRAAFTAELERRWQDYLANPESAIPAEEVIAELRSQLKSHAAT